MWPLGRFFLFIAEFGHHSLAIGASRFAFWFGLLTTAIVLVAWCVNIVDKELATLFGGLVSAIGMLFAIGVRRAWFIEALMKIPFVERLQARAYRASENLVEDELKGLMTLAEIVARRANTRLSRVLH